LSLSLLRFFYRTFDVVQSVLAGSDRKYLIFKLQKFQACKADEKIPFFSLTLLTSEFAFSTPFLYSVGRFSKCNRET
jgi:hypothetical protein